MERIDVALVTRNLADSRTKAQRLIEEGAVTVNGVAVHKPSTPVREDDEIHVDRSADICRYVSRGGLKLEAALSAFPVTAKGRICLDIGASTGGFTDCLLQNGAAHVYAVDSGKKQLSERLLSDCRVTSMEEKNARDMTRSDFIQQPTLAVMDVSFVSQTLIFPAIAHILPTGGALISLIKPQFEVGRSGIGKNGIVKSESLRKNAVRTVCAVAANHGLMSKGLIESPITGGDGNIEYLAYFIRT